MTTPRDEAIINEVVSASNSLFWGRLAKLLKVQFPATLAEKTKLMRQIKGRFDAVENGDEVIKKPDKDVAIVMSHKE